MKARLKPQPVIGLVRLHAYRQGVFNLVDVPAKEARRKAKELTREGFVVTHSEHI